MAVCFRRTRRATISAAIVSGRITFEFEGSKGEEAGRRRGERWDQDHSVDRLMRCNTVAITDPSLLPPLLSPFFFSLSLSFRPLIPHPFASLSISFLIPALLELFFFPLFLLESSNSLEDRRRIVKNVKFTRYSMIQLKMEGKNSEEKILRRVNLGFRGGNQSAVATRCGAPASMTSTFLPLLVALLSAIFSQRAHTGAQRVSATRAHAFRIHLLRCHRHVAFTLAALPAS